MKSLTVIPAIDLKSGKCVRLRRGRAEDQTVYDSDPVAVALAWQARGAEWLHVVDLDGAFTGRTVHDTVIREIVAKLSIPVQTGGGLRSREAIAQRIAAGAARVILGTRACADPDALADLAEQYGDRLAVGIDARDGYVQIKGWLETTGMTAVDLARRIAAAGVATLIYTNTATDGMLAGPDCGSLAAVCDAAPACAVIASGGVASAAHVTALRRLKRPNLVGTIVGKALYDGVAEFKVLQNAAAASCP